MTKQEIENTKRSVEKLQQRALEYMDAIIADYDTAQEYVIPIPRLGMV